jgi:hypothetical protein
MNFPNLVVFPEQNQLCGDDDQAAGLPAEDE